MEVSIRCEIDSQFSNAYTSKRGIEDYSRSRMWLFGC